MWKYKGPAGWHFVTLPKVLSKKIRRNHGKSEEGWGRLKVLAQIGQSQWKTAIWFDTKADSYLLPLKASVRKSEGLKIGSGLNIVLKLQSEKFKIIGWM